MNAFVRSTLAAAVDRFERHYDGEVKSAPLDVAARLWPCGTGTSDTRRKLPHDASIC